MKTLEKIDPKELRKLVAGLKIHVEEEKYRLFKHIKGNRALSESKIKGLMKSYEGGLNLFPYCPVLVNDQFYIIDGQHRLEACRRLKIPVFYLIVPKITIVQIAELNNLQTKWTIKDFFECFIETGNTDYKTLQIFKEKYNLSLNIANGLLMGGSATEGGHIADKFRQGLFKVRFFDEATAIMNKVFDYKGMCDDKLLSDRVFIKAIEKLLKSKNYDHKEVVARLKNKRVTIDKKANWREYIYHIEELYNKGNSKRYLLYVTDEKDPKEKEPKKKAA